MPYLWVALGGAMGSVSRFMVSGLLTERLGATFPWGTTVANISGSFVIGILVATLGGEGRVEPQTRSFVLQFLMTGFCGGYTTFSSFSMETFRLLREREWLMAGGNVLFSVVCCLLAVWAGWALGASLNSSR